MARKIFISYAHEDARLASQLRNALRGENLLVLSNWELQHTHADMLDSIREAVAAASAVLILVGPNYKDSRWLAFESGMAMALNKNIIVLKLDTETEVPADLMHLKQFTLSGTSPQVLAEKINASIGD